jgi:hypothetical protein
MQAMFDVINYFRNLASWPNTNVAVSSIPHLYMVWNNLKNVTVKYELPLHISFFFLFNVIFLNVVNCVTLHRGCSDIGGG